VNAKGFYLSLYSIALKTFHIHSSRCISN